MSAALDLERLETTRLVDLLLEEQQDLSAVERFSQRHAAQDTPLQARYYSDLIPVAAPGKDQQYAFRVDLDACTGCKACVTACHSLNGLDENETWRDVGLLIGAPDEPAFQQTVTTACHHCEDPGCLAGCPVMAYEKDETTGIVRHLDDQCIGCQYCVMKCPYDVPKYNPSKGIVRKCDMCSDRLGHGEAPACVQGCPNGAISIAIVERGAPGPDMLLPVADEEMPRSSNTRPTTRYVSRRPLPERVAPADVRALRPADAHTPLSIMLVLSQLSVGAFCFDLLAGGREAGEVLRLGWIGMGLAFGLLGQAAAMLHLGRPQYAFRAFLGWRTSWMSREILVLGAYTGVAIAAACAAALPVLAPSLPEPLAGFVTPLVPIARALDPLLIAGTIAIGLLGTFCSAMIYADTHRRYWRLSHTLPRFVGSAWVLGAATGLAVVLAARALGLGVAPDALLVGCAAALGFGTLAKLGMELGVLRHLGPRDRGALGRTARLLAGPLRGLLGLRCALGIAGGVLLPAVVWAMAASTQSASLQLAGTLAVLGFAGCLGAELAERRLYFTAVAPRAMPGQG